MTPRKTQEVKLLRASLIVFLFLTLISQAQATRLIKKNKTVFNYPQLGKLQVNSALKSQVYRIGKHSLYLGSDGLSIQKEGAANPAFVSIKNNPFIVGGLKTPNISTNKYGSLFTATRFRDKLCKTQTIDQVFVTGNGLQVMGRLVGDDCFLQYGLLIKENELENIELQVHLPSAPGAPVWTAVTGYRSQDELFYGGGEQFTELVLNGHRVPFMIQEQGHGRSSFFKSLPLDALSKGLSGGDLFSTYIPVASTMTSKWRGLKLKGPHFSILDLEKDNRVTFWSHSNELRMEIFAAKDALSAVKKVSESAGLPHKVPEWFYEGAMLGGFVGGEKVLQNILDLIDEHGIHTKTLWIEDWCGVQPTASGSKRLKWNWEVDRSLYPHWDEFRKEFEKREIRIGGYLNSLTRVLNEDHYRYNEWNMPNLLKENGHLILDRQGEVAATDLGRIDAFFVDLLNPKSYDYLKKIAREKMLAAGIQFWNADFGEGLPIYNEYTKGSSDSLSIRHKYIDKWAQFNHELIHDDLKGDGVAFIRSGHTDTLKYNQMYWQGDQLTTYDEHDGLYSTTIANITGGLSGILINHSDVGGAVKFLNIKRNKGLVKRWMEKETFGPLLRSKEGLGTLKLSIIEEPELMKEFAKWSRVFHALFPYRDRLYKEAYEGLPMIRAMFLHFPQDKKVYELKDQFMFGESMLVAPIHNRQEERSVYLPAGNWTHFIAGQSIRLEEGKRITVRAPMGCPPVFFKSENAELQKISQDIAPEVRRDCRL